MKKITPWLKESSYIQPLSPACQMCANGSKLVMLITGLCPAHCFYCPLSFKKGGKDVIYANEWKLTHEDDTEKIIKEARNIEAEGAGITGGDPLVVWKRTRRYITILKNEFGSSFHIHLYTSGLKNKTCIPDLAAAGLDEIRFHPTPAYWGAMEKSPILDAIRLALSSDIDVAMEIPSIPNMEEDILALIRWAEEKNINWVNLNELEFSERNADELIKRNFIVKNDISAAVKGSQETANNVMSIVIKNQWDIGVHYCSASFKDGIQLTNRIKRRARNVAQPYEVITEEGTVLKGIISSPTTSLNSIYQKLIRKYEIPKQILSINREKNRVETSIDVVFDLAAQLLQENIRCHIIEEYPTADRLEVERIPLP